jgi:hypothetical protein
MAVSFNFTGEYAIDQGADWYATFIYKQPAEITNIVGNGTTVTVTAVNGFTAGQVVSIDGVNPSTYNLQNVTIATANGTSFTITNAATGTYISGGLATAPVNLTGATAALQIRSLPSSPDTVLSLATGGNGITITGATGQVDVHATANQTRAIDPGFYYYDLEVTDTGGSVTRLAQGQAEISAEVTR